MTQEVAVTEGNVVAAASFDDFASDDFSSQDLVIPKILLMQGLSKLVMEGDAKFGDFVDSLSGTTIGNIKDKPLNFIPFYMNKTWIVSKKDENGRFQFQGIEPWTAANQNRKWEEVRDGAVYKNELSMNYYVLLTEDMSMPYLLQFKSTSIKAGKELSTQMFIKNKSQGLTPASKVMSLSGSKVENDKGTYAVLKTSIAGDSTEEQVLEALNWVRTVKAGAVKVDDSDTRTVESAPEQF